MKLKSEMYKQEQLEIMNKIINILQLDNDNGIVLYEFDNDKQKQGQILNLIPEIRKYFSLSTITSIRDPTIPKRPYLSIVKHITKLEYKMLSCDYKLKINNNEIRTKKYIFVKK